MTELPTDAALAKAQQIVTDVRTASVRSVVDGIVDSIHKTQRDPTENMTCETVNGFDIVTSLLNMTRHLSVSSANS